MASEIKANKISPATGTALTIGDLGDTLSITGTVSTTGNSTNTGNLDVTGDLTTTGDLTVDSEIKSNKISPATGTNFTLGDSGDTFTVPSGTTFDIASGATITNSGTVSGFGVNTPIFMTGCYNATGYYTYSNNVNTKVAFNTELVDTDSAFDSSTNYRFTVPSGKGGKYYISAGVQIYNSSNISNAYLWLFKNGGAMGWSRLGNSSTNGGYIEQLNVDRVFDLNAGDYLEVYVQLDGTGTNYLIVDTVSGYGRVNWFCGWRLIT